MAAPTYVQSSAGAVITATSGNTGNLTGVTVGNFIVLQFLSDGTASAPGVTDTNSTINNVAGTSNSMTQISPGGGSPSAVGSPTAAEQAIFLGRAAATTVNVDVFTLGADMYVQLHEFTNVSTGTTIATVIENGVASGSSATGAGTGTTVSDTGVTTLGADRLALNLIAINDDLTGIASFTGETGGNWAQVATFESSTGTDGTVALQTAAMASAGTIDGGSATITSDAWGVVGFALIGTTPSTQPPHEPLRALQAVNRSSVF